MLHFELLPEEKKLFPEKKKRWKRQFLNKLINSLTDPHAQAEAINGRKIISKNNIPHTTFDANELEQALVEIDKQPKQDSIYTIYGMETDRNSVFVEFRDCGLSEDDMATMTSSEKATYSAAIFNATATTAGKIDNTYYSLTSKAKTADAALTDIKEFTNELNQTAGKFIRAIRLIKTNPSLDDILKAYNTFIGYEKDKSFSFSTLLNNLLKQDSEFVENSLAHTKYLLKYFIHKGNREIIDLYSANESDPRIAEIKADVQKAENVYLGLKKLERAYYKADKERSYSEVSQQLFITSKRWSHHDYDAKHTVENTGSALNTVYLFEKIDPKRRDWGSPVERNTCLVKTKAGKIVFSSNSKPAPNNRYIYVIDLHGNVYIKELNNNKIRHPNFLSGENVKCAGELEIRDGKIISIDNASGHYSPGPFSLNSALTILEKNNMLHPEVKIEDRSKGVCLKDAKDVTLKTISLSQYREECAKLEDAYGITFLNTVKDINLYMKKRAKETREFGFVSKLFGYSGQDYYDRRKHWEGVLNKLLDVKNKNRDRHSQNSLLSLFDEIDKGIKEFGTDKMSARSDYANKLKALRDQLSNFDFECLNKPYIRKYLTSSKKVYENLGAVSNSVNNYVTTETKTSENKNLSNFTHRLSGHRLKAKGRSEFLTKAEVKETEFTNSLSGSYKRV